MYFDKRVLYIIIAIMVAFGLANYLSNPTELLYLLLTIPGVLIAITFHEFAHAFAADKLGDDTPRMEGRLSLNPLAHLDPIGSLMLLFAGFGWGKPVHVNPRNYNRTMSMDKADAIVAIAGPVMNFILAIVLTLIYCAIYKFASLSFISSQIGSIIMMMIMFAISINVGLGVFNLIPLPPLDGSKVIKPFLPYNAKMWFENNQRMFEMIFVVLWIVGILSTIISPIIQAVYSGIIKLGMAIFGL
jgi:Zn-dependent protease